MRRQKPIITRKPIKHLYLRISIDGELLVSAPKRMAKKEIMAFLADNADWIAQKQQQQAKRKKQRQKPHHSSEQLNLFGQTYPLAYQRGGQGSLQIINNVGELRLRSDATAKTRDNVIRRFYRQQLFLQLEKQVARYQPIIGVSVNEIRIKQMKTKWGTCNRQAKRLWFNLQLVHLPLSCLEYVVVHEMTHLLEARHNARFYHLVENVLPDWRVWHHYLRNL